MFLEGAGVYRSALPQFCYVTIEGVNMNQLKVIVGIALAVFGLLLSGCAQIAENQRRAELECRNQGGVIYHNECWSPQALESEKNRRAMVEAACVANGGTWQDYVGRCQSGSKDVNVNVYRRY